jgi:hypothetical protein
MLNALEAAKDKLSTYYGNTTQEHGYLYAMGTILAPQYKLQFFSDESWADNDYAWRQKYHNHLQDYLKPYEQLISNNPLASTLQSQPVHTSELDILLAPIESIRSTACPEDELAKYLNSGMYNSPFY